MKRALVAAILYVVALSLQATAFELPPELKEIIEAAHQGCKEKTGVDEEILNKAMKAVMTDDPKLKCFVKCMFQELQAMRDDGSLDLELIEATMPAELKDHGAIDSLKQCIPPAGKELCQAAYDIMVCINNVNPNLSKLFE